MFFTMCMCYFYIEIVTSKNKAFSLKKKLPQCDLIATILQILLKIKMGTISIKTTCNHLYTTDLQLF